MGIAERGVPYYLKKSPFNTKRFFGFIFIVFFLLILTYIIIFLLAYVFEDISVKISPAQKSLYLFQGEKENITFDITLKTNPLCMSKCEVKLIDLSTEINISTDYFEFYSLNPDKTVNMTKEFTAPEFGLGQKLYNIKARCKNLLTPFCMTHGEWYEKTALVTLNYEFDSEKKELKDKSKETLELVLISLNNTDYELQKTQFLIHETENKTIFDEDTNASLGLAQVGLLSFKYLTDNLLDLWYNQEQYSKIIEKLDEATVIQVLKLENKSREISSKEELNIEKHNELSEKILQEETTFNLLKNENASFGEIDSFYNLYLNFLRLNFSSYPEIEKQISFNKFNLNSRFNGEISKASSEINTDFNLRCNLKGLCEISEKQNNGSQDNFLNITCQDIEKEQQKQERADNLFAYNYAIENNLSIENLSQDNAYALVYDYLKILEYMQNKKFIEETSNLYNFNLIISQNNDTDNHNLRIAELNDLILTYNSIREKANILIKQDGSEDLSICNNLTDLLNSENDSHKKEILVRYTMAICNSLIAKIISGENGTDKIPLEEINNISYYEKKTVPEFILSFPIGLETMAINLTSKPRTELDKFYGAFCTNQSNGNITLFNLTKIEIPLFDSFNQTIKTHVQEPTKICCVFGQCNPCCVNYSCYNNTETYPVIMIHGHEFNRANSPEYSLESLTNIEGDLEDNGYIDAGIILPTSSYNEIPQGEWGISGMPIITRSTYYYGVYGENGTFLNIPKTSEHIETYADRLNYMIELLKYRTNKDRVNIIAHSMGGLVAREYIKKYGEDSVYNLIMIGTPNNGIFGNVDEYCPVFGEKVECDEMKENSTFLTELNKYVPQNKTKFYTLIGTGCKMDGADGDGITLSKSVSLPYSSNYFINGTCPNVVNLLHTGMLNTEEYPLVSDIIKNILKSP